MVLQHPQLEAEPLTPDPDPKPITPSPLPQKSVKNPPKYRFPDPTPAVQSPPVLFSWSSDLDAVSDGMKEINAFLWRQSVVIGRISDGEVSAKAKIELWGRPRLQVLS